MKLGYFRIELNQAESEVWKAPKKLEPGANRPKHLLENRIWRAVWRMFNDNPKTKIAFVDIRDNENQRIAKFKAMGEK